MKKLFVLFALGMTLVFTGCSVSHVEDNEQNLPVDEVVTDYVKETYGKSYTAEIDDHDCDAFTYYDNGTEYVDYVVYDTDGNACYYCTTSLSYMENYVEV